MNSSSIVNSSSIITIPSLPSVVWDITSAPAGFFAFAYTNRDDIAKVSEWANSRESHRFFLICGPKGVWSSTSDEAIALVKKTAKKEVRKLRASNDLRPSEVKRLQILSDLIAS